MSDEQPEFRVDAQPSVRVVTPKARVTYRLVKNRPDAREPTALRCQWWVLNDPATSTFYRLNRLYGPERSVWEDATWELEGRHRIVCHLKDGGTEYVYEQNVASLPNVIAVGPTIPFQRDDPEAVLDAVSRKLALILDLAAKTPPATEEVRNRHKDQVAQLTDYRDRLKSRLESTKGLARCAVWAEHLDVRSQRRTPLKLFLARKGSNWVLVDWTNPTVQRMTGEYIGSGASTEEAVRNAFAKWDSDNRYPDGGISYRVVGLPNAPTLQWSFETDGSGFWDSVSSFFGYAGLALAIVGACATAVAPVPGSQVVSALIWGAILTGTVSAALNIGQRHLEGFPDAKADAFDVLSIVANCFGGSALWLRGARVVTPQIARAVLLGQVAADGAQGVLLSVESVDQINQINNDPNLTPNEKTERICDILRNLAIAGTLIAINIKGTKGDLENLKTPSKLFPGDKTPQQRLDSLKDPKATVDLTELPKLEGHAADGAHTTKVHIDQEEKPPQLAAHAKQPARSREQKLRDAMGNQHYETLKTEVPALRERCPEAKHLSDDELIALRGYLGNTAKPEFAGLKDYERINRALITNDAEQLRILHEYIETLKAALTKVPSHQGRVSRRLPFDVGDDEVRAQFKTGAVWTNKAFMSTSEGAALDHARAMLTFTKTQSGRSVSKFGYFTEREVLFAPGASFRVLHVMELPPGAPTRFLIMLTEL